MSSWFILLLPRLKLELTEIVTPLLAWDLLILGLVPITPDLASAVEQSCTKKHIMSKIYSSYTINDDRQKSIDFFSRFIPKQLHLARLHMNFLKQRGGRGGGAVGVSRSYYRWIAQLLFACSQITRNAVG